MRYHDGAAFRQALEQRLKARNGTDGARLSRDRKRVAFDRLFARLVAVLPDRWLLKGGFALDLRLNEQARATKDVDIEWRAEKDELIDGLIEAATWDARDFFSFAVERAGPPPEGLGWSHRFRLSAALGGRSFETFLLDVGFRGEPVTQSEILTTPDLLSFAELEPVRVPAMPLELQVAEKLHAYTRVYEGARASTRAKDLVDLALIARLAQLDAATLTRAIDETYVLRATHSRPRSLPPPPREWRAPFRRLAQSVDVAPDLGAGHATAAALLDPILSGDVARGRWSPHQGRWVA